MSKRLHDTEIWKKPWFYNLDDRSKLFWFYILSDCDSAGIWTANWKIAEAYLGKLSPPRLMDIFQNQIIVLNGGSYWFIKDFIKFQYGYPVSEKHTMFKTLKNILENRGLSIYTVYDTVSDTVLYTDKEKDKEKEKEIKGGVGGFSEREKNFIEEVKSFNPPGNIFENFISYWTEPNKSKTKMRWELQQTFDIKRRIETFKRNNREFSKPEKDRSYQVGENLSLK